MKIKELFTAPENWTRGAFARNEKGAPSSFDAAKSFCLVGALLYCYPSDKQRDRAREKMKSLIPCGLMDWNDDPKRTFEEVKEMVNKADV